MSWDDGLALRVVETELLCATLKRITFAAADGGELPTAPPGAHLMLTLPAPGRPLRRSYSLAGAPGDRRRYTIIVRRLAAGRGSGFVHDTLDAGAAIAAGWPANLFPLPSRARKHLLVSGGIGITPMLSYLPVLRAAGVPFELHHLCRAEERDAFEALLAPDGSGASTIHRGRAAFDVDAVLSRQPLGTHLSICGPLGLTEAVMERARAHGWPPGNLHSESFGAARGGTPCRVTAARSGHVVEVAEDETILEALEAAGLAPTCLCRGGACGACLTSVLAGEPEHHDHFLDEVEKRSGRMMMICVSRARSPELVLDL